MAGHRWHDVAIRREEAMRTYKFTDRSDRDRAARGLGSRGMGAMVVLVEDPISLRLAVADKSRVGLAEAIILNCGGWEDKSAKGSGIATRARLFIVAPTQAGEGNGDVLHKVCQTLHRRSFLDVYQKELYEEMESFGSLKDAVECCRRMGAKRPFVLR